MCWVSRESTRPWRAKMRLGKSDVARSGRRGAALLVTAISIALAASWLFASTLYWDANGSLSGNGTWDNNITQNWKTTNVAGAADSKWTPNDGSMDAQFGGATGAT